MIRCSTKWWLSLVWLLLLISAVAYADEYEPFQWETALCSCRAGLDTGQLSPKLANHIFKGFDSFRPSEKIFFTRLSDATIEELVSEKKRYKQEFDEALHRLQAIQLPEIPAVKKYHFDRIRDMQLNAYLYLAKLEFMISGNTTELEKGFLGEELVSECKQWSRVLVSKEETSKAMPDFIKQRCANNASPAECEMRVRAKTQTNSRAAQAEILTFGWHNCANHQYRGHVNGTEALKAIEPFLHDKKCECDEP